MARFPLNILQRLALYRFQHRVDFSFGWFSFYILLQAILWLTGLHYLLGWISPTLHREQFNDTWVIYLICFSVFHLCMSFFEFFFHRYVLHKVSWRFLKGLYRKHGKHHGLTHVREINSNPEPDGRLKVRNLYPITEPEQIESSAFPAYALVTFWGIFTPLIILFQIIWPSLPWIVTGYLAVAWSFWLYEVEHAIEHLDYDKWWRRWVERPDGVGRVFKKIYGFHLMHHSRVGVNLAISGFYCVPVPDLVFGTCFIPKELPLPGAVVSPASQEPPPPRWFIRWLDKIVEKREKQFKLLEKQRVLRNTN